MKNKHQLLYSEGIEIINECWKKIHHAERHLIRECLNFIINIESHENKNDKLVISEYKCVMKYLEKNHIIVTNKKQWTFANPVIELWYNKK